MTTYWDLPDELTGACTFKGLQTFDAGATIASGQTFTLTGATVDGAPTWSSGQTFPSVTAESLDYAGTLLIGTTNATQIDIGHAGITVNLYGAVNNINATDVYVPNDLEVDGVIYADGGIDVTSGLLNLNQSTKVVGNLSVETSLPGISLTDTGANKGLFSSSHALDIQVGVSVSTKKAIVIDVSGNSTILTGTTFTLTGVSVTGGTFASASLTAPILTGTATIASANLSGTLQMGAASTLAFTTGGQISGTIAGTPTWSGAHTWSTPGTYTFGANSGSTTQLLDIGSGTGLNYLSIKRGGTQQAVFGVGTANFAITNTPENVLSIGGLNGISLSGDANNQHVYITSSAITLSQPVTIGTAESSSAQYHSLYGKSSNISSFPLLSLYTNNYSSTDVAIGLGGEKNVGSWISAYMNGGGGPQMTFYAQSTEVMKYTSSAITLSQPVTVNSGVDDFRINADQNAVLALNRNTTGDPAIQFLSNNTGRGYIQNVADGAWNFVNNTGTQTNLAIASTGAVTLGPSTGTPNITHTLQSGTTSIATFAYNGIDLKQPVTLNYSAAPASASATGTAGQIAWDSSYIYICTAADTWKRVAISTW